jgi:hypothetical protein
MGTYGTEVPVPEIPFYALANKRNTFGLEKV